MYKTFKPEQPMGLMDFVRSAKACIKEIEPKELLDKLKRKEDFLLIAGIQNSKARRAQIRR